MTFINYRVEMLSVKLFCFISVGLFGLSVVQYFGRWLGLSLGHWVVFRSFVGCAEGHGSEGERALALAAAVILLTARLNLGQPQMLVALLATASASAVIGKRNSDGRRLTAVLGDASASRVAARLFNTCAAASTRQIDYINWRIDGEASCRGCCNLDGI